MSGEAGSSRTFVGSRRRPVISLVGSLAMAMVGLLIGGFVGWLVVAFFGYLAATWLLLVIRPNQLVLDPTGFLVTVGPRRRPERYWWLECGPFQARSVIYPWWKYVVFQTSRPARSQKFDLVQLVTDTNGAVGAQYQGIAPDSLAALMNDYRAQAWYQAGDNPAWR